MSDDDFTRGGGGPPIPTNRYAAKRPYCAKHGRAMLDIGGEKKCPSCRDEERKQAQVKEGGMPKE